MYLNSNVPKYKCTCISNEFVFYSLMHEVARFGNPSSSDSADDSSKRAAYVKLVVRLLSKCSLLNDARSDWFPPAVHQLLNDIELLSTAGEIHYY